MDLDDWEVLLESDDVVETECEVLLESEGETVEPFDMDSEVEEVV